MIELATTTTEVTQRGRRRDITTEAASQIVLRGDEAPNYADALAEFAGTLTRQRAKALANGGIAGRKVSARIESTGRKYDRVWLAVSAEVNGKPRWAVAYFVERATGNIFGPKSPVAINETRWFGSLATVADFDWSGEFPVCVTDRFVEVRRYGGCAHYRLADTVAPAPVAVVDDFPAAIAE